MIEHALDYAAKGWAIFPCDPRSKAPHPMLGSTGGFHHATLNVSVIEEWWSKDPSALIGSASSFAVDIDTEEGVESAMRLGLSAGAMVRTGNGWHAHFAAIDRAKPKGTVLGLTIRPVGRAYVIMPPSRHPDGAIYRWVNRTDAPALIDLPRLPEAALDVIAPPLRRLNPYRRSQSISGSPGEVTEGLRGHVDRVLEKLRNAPNGSRHPTAVSVAVHMARLERERNLPVGSFRDDVIGAALACGLDEEEVSGDGRRPGLVDWAWGSVA